MADIIDLREVFYGGLVFGVMFLVAVALLLGFAYATCDGVRREHDRARSGNA